MSDATRPTSPARAEFALLESWLASEPASQLPLYAVESEQHARGREVQRLLLQAHLDQRGAGDAGPALAVTSPDGVTQRYTHRRLSTRTITTIFGPVQIERLGYSHPGAPSVYPLDRALALPARSFSYELQRRLVKAAVLNPFQESVNTIAELTGVMVPKRSAEAIVRDAARDFDAFYQQRPPASGSGPILVAAIDCKGIPMVKPENTAPPSPRLTKGQKANRKRMATVAAVFTRQPWIRTPAQVIESLFRSRSKEESALLPTPPRPENKRVWASLTKGKAAVIDEVIAEMQRRDPAGSKTRLALTDGERVLQTLVDQKLGVALILDFIHVLEKLWKAAFVFHREGSLEAELWVLDRALRVLSGEVSQVVKGLRQSVTKRQLSGAKRATLLGVAAYLYRNRRRMQYDQYLANGWPIATGAVEGACKNLIKDRMERSGMRWTETMAEAVVKLRAIYLSGDFDSYWFFHIQQEQNRLHAGSGAVVPK
ncbi:MAG: ISKra4 family transposase [Planctomycetaceae bacterium]|nr:MAG: ISKra4 family transposase [Planctomycetaceae bacterium]